MTLWWESGPMSAKRRHEVGADFYGDKMKLMAELPDRLAAETSVPSKEDES